MSTRDGGNAGGRPPARVTTTILAAAPGGARVVLRRRAAAPAGAPDCELALSHLEAAASLALGPFEEVDAIALWRGVAASTGFTPGIEAHDGTLDWPFRQIGRVQLGNRQPRRRARAVGSRRPRFLVRRKAGRMPRRPLVYRESEIAAGKGT